MRKIFVFTGLLLFAFVLPILAADISGDWEIKIEGTPAGIEIIQCKIQVDGEILILQGKHSGIGDFSGFGEFKGDGTLKGNRIKMTMPFDDVQGPPGSTPGRIYIEFDGTVEGNKMEGTKKYRLESGEYVEVGSTNTWTGEKK